MSTQPEALLQAEKLLSPAILYTHDRAQIAAQLRQLHNKLEREKESRQAAQVENEDLKARLARAGLERRQAVLTKYTLLRQALKALKKYHGNFEHGELFTVQDEEECEKTIAAIKQHLGVQ